MEKARNSDHVIGIVETSSVEKTKNSDHVSLDLNTLVESVRADLETLPSFSASCSIYKVRQQLLELNKNAYTPRIVSIGPIHHGKDKKLIAMEEHKKIYLQEFLRRSQVPLEVFVKYIMTNETRLRNCYAETIELSNKDFVKMMLMDATFVIMILLKSLRYIDRNQVDRIFYRPMKKWEVLHDLCLLENQLPFFILDDLLKRSNVFNISTTKLIHEFLKEVWGPWVRADLPEEVNSSTIEHFVDFLGFCLKPSMLQPQTVPKALSVPSVNKLQQAGVKFELSPSTNRLDIEFDKKKGTLKLPQLTLEDRTEILFRNLIAFEQCHGCRHHLCDYIHLMDLLMNSAEDVEILVQNGIIENVLSNNEAVCTLFDSLGKENIVNRDKHLFAGLFNELDGYCKRRWNRWERNLKEKYFNSPWAAISVFAAAFLLLLTIIQSVCSIIQVLQW